MSIQGKNNLSYKKQNVQKQNAPSTGVKNITFAHIFNNVDEISIPFEALVTPPEWSTSGLVNPTSQSLLAAQLQVFKNNVTVTSSARGLIQKSEYIVFNNRIEFKNIASLANEVFEVEVADILKTGNLIVDMQTIRVEGELQDTETDFNIGYSFDVFDEEIVVFRDGLQMFRSDNNDSSGATGNYYYVDTDGDGKSSLIRFFDPSVGVEPVLVATTGGVVDSPNASTFQQIEHLAGQLDAVVPTVAALAGVPEDNFRAGPNNVDLKTFGDKVLGNENSIASKLNNYSSYVGFSWSDSQPVAHGGLVKLNMSTTNIEFNEGADWDNILKKYVAPSRALYAVNFSVTWVASTNYRYVRGHLYKNGSSIHDVSDAGGGTAFTKPGTTISQYFIFDVDDEIEFYVFLDANGSTRNVESGRVSILKLMDLP